MRRLAPLAFAALLVAGCGSSSDSSTEATPKGNVPNTIQAPPGAKGPEERAREAAQSQPQSAPADPGGDPGK